MSAAILVPKARKIPTSDDFPTHPPNAHDLAPISPINPYRCPSLVTPPLLITQHLHPRARMLRNSLFSALNLRRIKFGVRQARPHALNLHRIRAYTKLEASMHIRRQLEPRPDCVEPGIRCSRGQSKLREPIGYRFELHKRRKEYMHIGLTAPRLVYAFDEIGAQNADRDVLGDDHLSFSRAEVHAGVSVLSPTEAILVCVRSAAECIVRRRATNRVRHDCDGEERDVVLLRETDRGGGRLYGGFEGSLEGREGDFEVYDIVGGGLDGVGVEDSVLAAISLLRLQWVGGIVRTIERTLQACQKSIN
jgi:hypothetical protein